MNEEKKNGMSLVDKLKKNKVGIAGLCIGLIGIILAISFFIVNQKETDISYAVNPTRLKIATMGNTSGLEVLYNGANLGNVDITAVQIAIWNTGDTSIKKENILKTIQIVTNPRVKIIEASITNSVNDLDISGFSINDSKQNLDIGIVPVNWNILEASDGASVQLIYIGNETIEISIEGHIENVGYIQPKQLPSSERPFWYNLVSIVISLVAAILSFSVFNLFHNTRIWLSTIFSVLLWIILIIFGTYVFVELTPSIGTPFGF